MSHLTLIHGGADDDVDSSDDGNEHPPTWLCGTLHKERPFDHFRACQRSKQ